MPEIGQSISHYRITEKIGAGGMGEVFLAEDTSLNRKVAMKFLPPEMQRDETAHRRFIREARSAAALDHPFICHINEVAKSGDRDVIVMEYVEGQSLKDKILQGPLPAEEVLTFGVEVADALEAAHAKGIIHRDIKPGNIMLTQTGHAKVMDFGLAKQLVGSGGTESAADTVTALTSDGSTVGTLAYMSPEQLRAQDADGRSDIWALGVTLFEMATGTRPFHGQSSFELTSAILNREPWPLPSEVSAELGAVIERCLQKDPGKRYQHAGEVRAALEKIRSGTSDAWAPWRYWLRRHRWLALAAGIVAVVAVLAALDVGGVRNRLVGVFAGPKYRSLAILPLENRTGDPAQENFVDGMTDTLIAEVSKIRPLRVTNRYSVMRYKGAKKSLLEIARDLGVETVMTASVAREADRVRVTAQLIEAATDRSLWTETYERELAGILWIQGEVARAVARTIRIRLAPQEEARLAGKREVNPAAYEAYLRGIGTLEQDARTRQQGMAFLLEALEKDPSDPLTNARLALGYISLLHGENPPEDALPRAKAAVRTALELDSNLAEAHAASGMLKGYDDWDWEGGIREMQLALEINPSFANARYHLAWFYVLLGRINEAIAEHKRAQEIDPFVAQYTSQFAWLYRTIRRNEEAIKEAQKVIEMYPNGGTIAHYVLGLVHQDRGRYDEAIAEIQKAAAVNPRWKWALGPTYASAGRTSDARNVVAEMKQQKISGWLAYWFAQVYAALGEKDEAFRWLNYEHPHIWAPWLLKKDFAEMRLLWDDPRFRELQARMHVPQ
ncbi:MAG: protein kinase [Acidobacteriia bacterium]|nr:protein kinase [Terriglobia bacterium]